MPGDYPVRDIFSSIPLFTSSMVPEGYAYLMNTNRPLELSSVILGSSGEIPNFWHTRYQDATREFAEQLDGVIWRDMVPETAPIAISEEEWAIFDQIVEQNQRGICINGREDDRVMLPITPHRQSWFTNLDENIALDPFEIATLRKYEWISTLPDGNSIVYGPVWARSRIEAKQVNEVLMQLRVAKFLEDFTS